MDHQQEQNTSLENLNTPERQCIMLSSSRKLEYGVQQSPTSVVTTKPFSADAIASGITISIDKSGNVVTKDLPMLEDASDNSQESAEVEREFRSLMECALWQRQFIESRTSKLVELLWERRWERVKDRLHSTRHGHEVRAEVELPCFYNGRGLPLHVACAMRPLPPAAVIKLLIDAFPEATQTPERTWGMLPLHLVADLRFQRRTGGRKDQCGNEVFDVDLDSTESSSSSTLSAVDADEEHNMEGKLHQSHGTDTKDKSHHDETRTIEHDCSPAAHHGKVVELVLAAFPEGVQSREKLNGMIPLHIAACTGYSHNGLVSETSFVVLELLLHDAPETMLTKDDWGHTAVFIAWQETVFHCALCGPQRSSRCPHVWSLPRRFINPLFRGEKNDLQIEGEKEGTSFPTKDSKSEKRPSFPLYVNIPVDIAVSIASSSESWRSPQQKFVHKRDAYDEALLGAFVGEKENIENDFSQRNDKERDRKTAFKRESCSNNPLGANGVGNFAQTHETESIVTQKQKDDAIVNLYELEALRKTDKDERLRLKQTSETPTPIGKDVCVDKRFGPFGERFGVDAKSLLTIRIHVSHLKAGKGKAKIGALVKAPNPFVELAVVAKGKKMVVYQSHPLTHRSEATWEAQEISLGLGIKAMYKAACLFTVYHCRRKGGTPLLIGSYYCAFKDLPTSPVAICRGGKPKGLLCINAFSLEEIPKPCERVRL